MLCLRQQIYVPGEIRLRKLMFYSRCWIFFVREAVIEISYFQSCWYLACTSQVTVLLHIFSVLFKIILLFLSKFSLEHAVAIQLSRKLQRAFVYAEVNDLWMGMPKTLVVSGGVACNNRIRSYLRTVIHVIFHTRRIVELKKKSFFPFQVSEAFEVNLVAPEAKYCTDNGVMIAWNGLEKWRRHIDIVPPSEVFGPSMSIFPRAPFGTDISDILTRESIKCKWIKESEIIEQHKLTNRV